MPWILHDSTLLITLLVYLIFTDLSIPLQKFPAQEDNIAAVYQAISVKIGAESAKINLSLIQKESA